MDSGKPDIGGTFLVGYNKNLYHIGADFQVGIPANGYDAVGCGSELALGSLHSTQLLKLKPEQRVKMALEAAAHFSGGVEPPFVTLKQINK